MQEVGKLKIKVKENKEQTGMYINVKGEASPQMLIHLVSHLLDKIEEQTGKSKKDILTALLFNEL